MIAHCEHMSGYGENADPECCICADNPCGAVTVAKAIAHGIADLNQHRESFEEEISYAIKHGHRMPNPWDALTAPQTWTTTDDVDLCAVLAEVIGDALWVAPQVADEDVTWQAEDVIQKLRARGYDVVPSPAYEPERFTPPF